MTEYSRFWDGHTVGDATDAPYSDLDWAGTQVWKHSLGEGDQGVIGGIANELQVYCSVGFNTLYIKSGSALVNGRLYSNSAEITLGSSPFGVSVWWVVGLFSDESAHTIRAFARGNYATEALAKASITQTPGGDWEILIATFNTEASQLIGTIYDQRMWVFRARRFDFIPAVGGVSSVGPTNYRRGDTTNGDWGVILPSGVSSVFGHYYVPHHYYRNLTITPIVTCLLGSGDVYARTVANYEQLTDGVYTTHVQTAAYAATTITQDHVTALPGLTITDAEEGGGDLISMVTTRDEGNGADTLNFPALLAGWIVEYESLY